MDSSQNQFTPTPSPTGEDTHNLSAIKPVGIGGATSGTNIVTGPQTVGRGNEPRAKHKGNFGDLPQTGVVGAEALAALAEAEINLDGNAIDDVIARWDEEAGVRTRPRRVIISAEEANMFFFTPELVPHITHPVVAELGPEARHRLLVEHFHTYSNFTEQLEDKSVIAAGVDIVHGLTGIELPDRFVAGARTLIADEAWHSLFTYDKQNQVIHATAITPRRGETPAYLKGFSAIQLELPAEYRTLSRLLFAVVSETLITGTLTQVPKDARVAPVVRNTFEDHASDERRHHVYFAALFREVWPKLSRRDQNALGPLLAKFVRLFLDPDKAAAQRALQALPLDATTIEQVIVESYPAAKVAAAGRMSAKATLRLFKDAGVLDLALAREAFDEYGLLG